MLTSIWPTSTPEGEVRRPEVGWKSREPWRQLAWSMRPSHHVVSLPLRQSTTAERPAEPTRRAKCIRGLGAQNDETDPHGTFTIP